MWNLGSVLTFALICVKYRLSVRRGGRGRDLRQQVKVTCFSQQLVKKQPHQRNRRKLLLISPSELEPAVLLQKDLLLLPPPRVASAGHHGDEAGRGQKQTGHRSRLHLSQVAAPPLTWCQHAGRCRCAFMAGVGTSVSRQKPGSEHKTSEEEEVPARSDSRGSAGACAGVQPPKEHPSAAAAFSRPPLTVSSALLSVSPVYL